MQETAVKKINLPDDLFEEDTFHEEPMSKEMKALVEEQERKSKNRQKRNKRKTISATSFNRSRQEVDRMWKKDEWDNCEARHLIALYEKLHLLCYDVDDASLTPESRYKATMMALNFVKREFSGNFEKAIAYFRWAWGKERATEKWRRENNVDGKHLTWYSLFSGWMLTKYRLHLARKRV